jgi:hypothetical protein
MRAIYIGDAIYNVCHVFEYDEATKLFHMVDDRELNYPFELVMKDPDWILFASDGETVYQIQTLVSKDEL